MQAEPAGLFVADRDEEAQPGCSGTLSSQRRPRLVRNCARGAGTHNPWRSRFQNLRCNLVSESKVLGVWVPAKAGTTDRARSHAANSPGPHGRGEERGYDVRYSTHLALLPCATRLPALAIWIQFKST
jgi:hypothetical protein